MNRSKIFYVFLILAVLPAWWLWPGSDSNQSIETTDLAPLADRVWIDHIPKNERDKVDVFVMLEEPAIGAFSRSSAYEGEWTSFEWNMRKGLHFRMLQTQKSHKVSATIIGGDKCAPFDYCLRLKGVPRASKRYYSMEDWVINAGEDHSDARALLEKLSFPRP